MTWFVGTYFTDHSSLSLDYHVTLSYQYKRFSYSSTPLYDTGATCSNPTTMIMLCNECMQSPNEPYKRATKV